MNAFAPVVLESAGCPLGCRKDDEFVLTGRDRLLGLPGEFAVVRCRSCGLMRTDPRPTSDSIGFYYPDEYGPYRDAQVSQEPDARPHWRRKLAALLWKLAETNGERLPPLPLGRLLEVGCASGSFLDRMSGRGWQVEGLEFSATAGERARKLGYPVQIGRIETASAPAQPFDLIIGWMVLEHLHDPLSSVKKLRSWVRPGGWLALSVPDASSLWLSVFRSAWYPLDLPRHLYHFDRRTLGLLLERGGWEVRRFISQRTSMDLVASFGYVLKDVGVAPSLSEWLKNAPERGGKLPFFLFPVSRLLSLLHQTGRVTAWAQRPDD